MRSLILAALAALQLALAPLAAAQVAYPPRAAFRGALVVKSADQTGANYTTAASVAWDAEDYDTDATHDTVTENTRLTVPAGVTKIRLGLRIRTASNTADTWQSAHFNKNGAATYNGFTGMNMEAGLVTPAITFWSPVLTVVVGDYFEARFQTESDASIDIIANGSWFGMEIVE